MFLPRTGHGQSVRLPRVSSHGADAERRGMTCGCLHYLPVDENKFGCPCKNCGHLEAEHRSKTLTSRKAGRLGYYHHFAFVPCRAERQANQ
jgi:hypothetical protein